MRQRQAELCELKASLGYRVSSSYIERLSLKHTHTHLKKKKTNKKLGGQGKNSKKKKTVGAFLRETRASLTQVHCSAVLKVLHFYSLCVHILLHSTHNFQGFRKY